MNQVILGDSLEVLKQLEDNSVDLICVDPPYYKVKKDWWDRQWDKPEGFLTWLDGLAEQWERILKPNGSLYCFASPQMSARVEVNLLKRFNVLNRITWQKPPYSTKAEMNKKENSRCFFPASESIIFCEHYGSDCIVKGASGYKNECDKLRGSLFEPLINYFESERKRGNIDKCEINRSLGFSPTPGGMASRHYFSRSQWWLPTEEHYGKLQNSFVGFFEREYAELKNEYETIQEQYEELRLEYEELRRPFSITAEVPYTDVWTFKTVNSYPGKHPCEKPPDLLEHIILSSSRPGAVVLDCFCGSGNTLVAAKKHDRNFIGIDIDPEWVSKSNEKLAALDKKVETPTSK